MKLILQQTCSTKNKHETQHKKDILSREKIKIN